MNSIKISAPAKVNLFLKVLNKRKDGYHNILTLFERISLADVITISKRPSGIALTSDKFITRNPKDNLAYKAAELILKKGRIKSGVKIHIKKNIPIAAGLGGGSSDAASVLMGLNDLFGIGLNPCKKGCIYLNRQIHPSQVIISLTCMAGKLAVACVHLRLHCQPGVVADEWFNFTDIY